MKISSPYSPRYNGDLVLVVEYHPGEPISVALSRKAKISDFTDAKPMTPYVSTPEKSDVIPEKEESHEPVLENPARGLRVTFPDGTVIYHRIASKAFVEVLRKIGFNRIPQVGIIHKGYNLVSRDQRPEDPERRVRWQLEADGWYIYTNIDNATKVQNLKKISEFFNSGLTIEL